jgi:hypothetical protein
MANIFDGWRKENPTLRIAFATVAIGAALALAGCTAGTEIRAAENDRATRDLGQALVGRTAGEPRECIAADFAKDPQIIDRRTILYRNVGRVLWRNDLPENCPMLGPHETLSVELWGSQLCRNDLVRVIYPGTGSSSGPCRLGKFTPYRKAP